MSESILLADDSPIVLKLLTHILEPEGYELILAKNGQEAVDLFHEHRPAMLLLDVMMPKKTGYEVCESLHDELENVPVFFLSARDDAQARMTGLELGAVDFISKPFQKREIIAKIRNQLKIQKLTSSLIDANKELLQKQSQIQDDLRAAADIQQSLVLHEDPGIPNTKLGWQFLPCDAVGGDIFGSFRLDEENWCLFMVDVSGHGVPSAMVTVSVSQALSPGGHVVKKKRSDPPSYEIRSPVEVLRKLDKLYPIERFEKYFTISYLIYNAHTGALRYSSAAHPPPIVQKANGEILHLTEGGSIIGLGAIVPYEGGECELSSGDRLYLYTDGVVEIMRDNEECFGEERLADSITRASGLDLQQACQQIVDEAIAFSESDKPQDDISVLAIELE